MKPVDLTFLEALASKPTLEEELIIEKRVLAIKETHDIDDLRKYAIALQRQNLHQSYFIANCLAFFVHPGHSVVCRVLTT